jgi:hypothetical protein
MNNIISQEKPAKPGAPSLQSLLYKACKAWRTIANVASAFAMLICC